MNIENKYNNYLTDLISLLQEALIRTFAQKPIDQHKFSYYFSHIYTHMAELEESFNNHSPKITKVLKRLYQVVSPTETDHPQQKSLSVKSKHATNLSSNRKPTHMPQTNDISIQKPTIKINHHHKTITHSKELKSIQQLEEEHQFIEIKGGKRRSETANGYRQKKVQSQRPFTGKRVSNRYNSISVDPPNNPLTEQESQSSFFITHEHNNQTQELKEKVKKKIDVRQSFYDELLKEKDSFDIKGGNTISYILGLRNRNSKSQRKWVHKINRLL